jgi:carboxyl-terminal processing protease
MRCTAPFMILALVAAACGGDDPSVPDSIEPRSIYAGKCESPRTGVDPFSGEKFTDTKGSLLDEELWLRSWTDDTYLWYSEVPANDPKQYTTTLGYFDILKTPATTKSGRPKDQFHFWYKTSDWEQLSSSGTEAGYGFQVVLLSRTVPRKAVIAYAEPNTPAAAATIDRGAEITSVDGVDLVNGNTQAIVDTLNAGLFPAGPGENHTFVIVDLGSTTPRTVQLTSATTTSVPVRNFPVIATPSGPVGYIVFNDHIGTAEKGLFDAITQLQSAQISDLVLDMRYNGGGYLALAAQLGFMIAGPTRAAGKTFELQQFNDKHTAVDPVTGQPLSPTPFITQTIGLSLAPGMQLPSVNLPRVFILTGPGTCSASEAVMNGLAGIDVDVIQIGATTCGKPYGFYPEDNCGTTYFSIQFQGVNNKGFGDYADGFVPGGTGVFPHSCVVADDFTHALGDPAEGRLAAALAYRTTGQCPPASNGLRERTGIDLSAADGEVPKSVWRQNRILTHGPAR